MMRFNLIAIEDLKVNEENYTIVEYTQLKR